MASKAMLSKHHELAIEASLARFQRSLEGLPKLTHHSRDNESMTTIRESSARYERRSLSENLHVLKNYDLGVEAEVYLRMRLANPTPEHHEHIYGSFYALGFARDDVRRVSIHAQMRNENCAKRAEMVVKIRNDYFLHHQMFEYSSCLLIVFACMTACGLWGLDQLRDSIARRTHLRLTPSESRDVYFARIILRTQQKWVREVYMSIRYPALIIKNRFHHWEHQRLFTFKEWDRNFDEAVTLRAYARNLAQKATELEPEVLSLSFILECNAMACGWERTMLEDREVATAHLADARKQVVNLFSASAEDEKEAVRLGALHVKWRWLSILNDGPVIIRSNFDVVDDAVVRKELSRYIASRRLEAGIVESGQLHYDATWPRGVGR